MGVICLFTAFVFGPEQGSREVVYCFVWVLGSFRCHAPPRVDVCGEAGRDEC